MIALDPTTASWAVWISIGTLGGLGSAWLCYRASNRKPAEPDIDALLTRARDANHALLGKLAQMDEAQCSLADLLNRAQPMITGQLGRVPGTAPVFDPRGFIFGVGKVSDHTEALTIAAVREALAPRPPGA